MKIIGIQYLRGIAAMLVVLFHIPGDLTPYPALFHASNLGPVGVDIFFVISGFVMAVSTSKPIRAVEFMRHRIVRVVPLYWFFTAVMACAALAAPRLFPSTVVTLESVVQSLLFIPHVNPGHEGAIWPLLPPGWTLNYEMFFYLVFAVMIAVGLGRKLWPFIVVFGVLALCGVFYDGDNPIILTYTAPLLLEFVFGVVIGHAFLRGLFEQRLWLGWLIVPALVAIVLAGEQDNHAFRFLFWGVPAALLVAGTLALEPLIRQRSVTLLQMLGDASYSIYLSHIFTVGISGLVWNRIPQNGTTVIIHVLLALVLSAAVGWIVHRLIEKPLLRLGRKRQAPQPKSA